MRVIILANNWVGWYLTSWLAKYPGVKIVGLVVHPETKQKYRKEIVEAASLSSECIFDAPVLRQVATIEKIASLSADIGLSFYFGYLLKPVFLDLFPLGVVNLHPSFLPYNKGAYPNVWSIIDDTPAGTTLHYIDSGIDTGKIIAQQALAIDPKDTGKSLHEKLEKLSVRLFCETWPKIMANQVQPVPQTLDVGTVHFVKDVDQIDEIDLEKTYRAKDLVNLLRARTFPPYKGCYFLHEGRKIFIRVQLLEEEELNNA
ncbi:MAG: formyl transferase [Anaerolineaceae bacterium]|nr:formyl transferase [Anaerolineaceae bacterium]